MKQTGFAVVVAVSLAIVPALAKGIQRNDDSKSGQVGLPNAAPDRKFVMDAAKGGMAEWRVLVDQLCHIARGRAREADCRKFDRLRQTAVK